MHYFCDVKTPAQFAGRNVVIKNSGKLTINEGVILAGTWILVKTGGELVIDAARLANADIRLEPGSIITIRNGGKVEQNLNHPFSVPYGAILNLTHGNLQNYLE